MKKINTVSYLEDEDQNKFVDYLINLMIKADYTIHIALCDGDFVFKSILGDIYTDKESMWRADEVKDYLKRCDNIVTVGSIKSVMAWESKEKEMPIDF